MRAVETEIKFRVEDSPALEQRLLEAGFRNITPRTFERNILYDTPERRLRRERQILRIRRYGPKWIVTHKRLATADAGTGAGADGETANDAADSRHKHRIETETEVEDGETMAAVFETLGFAQVFVYEKWRAEWTDEVGYCVIDETPIGVFAELEGPPEWIDASAIKLGVDASQFLMLSYGRMFEAWKAESACPATNMTFAEISGSVAVRAV